MKRQVTAALTLGMLSVSALLIAPSAPTHAAPVQEPQVETPKESAVEPPPVPGYALNWGEEFNGSDLNTNDWLYRTDERVLCANRPDNVSVSDGKLHIALRQESAGAMDYTCGGAISKKWFGYGYYETKAKLWSDRGFHSSFWQMGLTPGTIREYTGPANQVNEIDGFEIDSHDPGRVASNTHYYTPRQVWGGPVTQIEDTGDAEHVFGWEWTPTKVTFYVDGKPYGSVDYPGPHATQNVWLTSLGFTPPVDNSNLPGEVTFDYFRYFTKSDTPRESSRSVVVDNADPTYTETGSWNADSQAYGASDKATRRTDEVGAAATWTSPEKLQGSYEVYVWNPSFFRTSDKKASFRIDHAGGSDNAVVDQLSSGQQWILLGSYNFSADSEARVVVQKTDGSSGSLRTDAVKFVPSVVVDDGGENYSQDGNWSTSETTGYVGKSARITRNANAEARWSLQAEHGGFHDISAWIPPIAGAATQARYRIDFIHQGRTRESATVTVDQTAYGAGAWASLGTHQLAKGEVARVTLLGADGAATVADAVRAVRNDQVDEEAPDKPTGVVGQTTVIGSDEALNGDFTWNASTAGDVIGYNVYMDGVRVNWQPVHPTHFSVAGLRFGHTYEVSVRAVDSSGNESEAATADVAMPEDTTAPSAPYSLAFEALDGGGIITWKGPGSTYNVFIDGVKANVEPLLSSSYRVTGLTNGSTHQFTATASDYSGNESALSEALTSTVAPAYLVRLSDPGFTMKGTWNGSGISGWAGTATLASLEPAATARWETKLPDAGNYEVLAWVPTHPNSTAAARYLLSSVGGPTKVQMSQQTGGMGWVSLGSHSFQAGSASVELSNSSGMGWLRASAVKFVRNP